MPMKKFRMTPTELRLKRERLMAAFRAGRAAVTDLGLPHFLCKGSALGLLREGQFQPFEDDVLVGIYAWDLAALQRSCPDSTAVRRDARMIGAFARHGFEPVSEVPDAGAGGPRQQQSAAESACPRTFIAEGWSQDMAFPIVYKFTHKEALVRFDIVVFAYQFGQLWDFSDGGAETSCGWRYQPFAPQPVEFEKLPTFSMPPCAIAEHYGPEWHVPSSHAYIESLSRCQNRCQVLRVLPWDAEGLQAPQGVPPPLPWEEFRLELRQHKIKYAMATGDEDHEVPAKALDLHKIESKPAVLFQAAEACKAEGNERLKSGNAKGALAKYDEGLYIMDKCTEVLVTWRLIFRQIHEEKAEENRKNRGLKYSDMVEPEMPGEFRQDEHDDHRHRLALALNGAQACLNLEDWSGAESRATSALAVDAGSLKALFRRGTARARLGREAAAAQDFWSMVKSSQFENKEAVAQLAKLMPKDELQAKIRKLKAAAQKEGKLGGLLTEMDGDSRTAAQGERYQRYDADCQQRKADGQREISFDDWVNQYEWRYDADERAKVRGAWPGCFSNRGVAPLPVEEWEVDYLTHKEVRKMMYKKQTEVLGAKRREREGVTEDSSEPVSREGFNCKLVLEEEDEQVLRDAVVQKGYNYWW